jgi:DNA (cytosine-5)-methyltransferase 1
MTLKSFTQTKTQKGMKAIRSLDLFAGVGGSSFGATMAGVKVVGAIDTWSLAKTTYLDNLPDVMYYNRQCEALSPRGVLKDIGQIQLLMASPECTSHTCAKGNAVRSDDSRNTAFQVIRFAKEFKPRWIIVENVIQMRGWDRFVEWKDQLSALGYRLREQVLNASDFGVPQSRKRLFVMCDIMNSPTEVIPELSVRTLANQIIEKNGTYRYAALLSPRRAVATLERARRAITELGSLNDFLLVYYGSDGSGGWQRLDIPLRTVTTIDRFAYVRPGPNGHEMRMLQVPELKRAMGFPDDYRLAHGTRRDRIKLLGNAVCPQVMKAVVESLVNGG